MCTVERLAFQRRRGRTHTAQRRLETVRLRREEIFSWQDISEDGFTIDLGLGEDSEIV